MEIHRWLLTLLFFTVIILVVRQLIAFQKKVQKLEHDCRYNKLDINVYRKGVKDLKRSFLSRAWGTLLIFLVICITAMIVNTNFYKFT